MFVFFGVVRTVLAYGIYLLLVLFIAYPAAYTVSYASGVHFLLSERAIRL